MSAYKPGTVAVATYCGDPNVRVSRYTNGWVRLDNPDDFVNDRDAMGSYVVADVRPLLVIDPAEIHEDYDAEQALGYLPHWLRIAADKADAHDRANGHAKGVGHGRIARAVAEQIEAQTRPPKPAEPTGRYAVVVDAAGTEWLRREPGDMWFEQRNSGSVEQRIATFRARRYAEIDAVKVLSEGVTS